MVRDAVQGYRLREGLTPIALSVIVNACLFALLAHSFNAPAQARERYIAVELAPVPPSPTLPLSHSPTLPVPLSPRPLVAPSPPRPLASSPRPRQAVLAAKQEIGVRPSRRPLVSMSPRPPFSVSPRPRVPASSDGVPAPVTDYGSRITGPATGPGAYVGPGDGGGTSEPTSPRPSGEGQGEGTWKSATTPAQPRPKPIPAEPPKPAPKGESRAAQVVGQTKPVYPSDARDDGVEGTTVVSVSLSADGKVISAKVVESSGDRRLDKAAVFAVERWKYSPCLRDGVPSAASIRVRVQFRLE